MLDEFQRPAGVRSRHHRLAGQERFQRHVAVVLVVGRIDNRQRVRVQVDESLIVNPAEKLDPVRDACLRGGHAQRLRGGAVAGNHEAQRLVGVAHRVDGELDAFEGLEPSHRQHVRAVRLVPEPVGQGRRMVQRLGRHAVETLQAPGRVGRDGVTSPALAQHVAVERVDPLAQPHVQVGMVEVAVFGAAQVVRRPVLVHQPDHLVRVADEVRRELRGDDQIHRCTVALAQIEQPPRGGVGQDFVLRVPLERHADDVRLVPGGAQPIDQRAHQQFGPPGHEGHLRLAHENPSHRHADRTALYRAGGGGPRLTTTAPSRWPPAYDTSRGALAQAVIRSRVRRSGVLGRHPTRRPIFVMSGTRRGMSSKPAS